uniref:Uncharacterized protein n=1 Tax=Cacopsylla melanoneura TaxID=428564 RepID=A0A8D8ZWM1_9HEMI
MKWRETQTELVFASPTRPILTSDAPQRSKRGQASQGELRDHQRINKIRCSQCYYRLTLNTRGCVVRSGRDMDIISNLSSSVIVINIIRNHSVILTILRFSQLLYINLQV